MIRCRECALYDKVNKVCRWDGVNEPVQDAETEGCVCGITTEALERHRREAKDPNPEGWEDA